MYTVFLSSAGNTFTLCKEIYILFSQAQFTLRACSVCVVSSTFTLCKEIYSLFLMTLVVHSSCMLGLCGFLLRLHYAKRYTFCFGMRELAPSFILYEGALSLI